ncbi:MAG: response regulator [Candidatus Cloacimonetes bacterium]|nr:response regulator [Candidatus Cloacimonadota bacterium]
MNCNETIDILLVEDNPNDAELIFRALKKNNVTDKLHLVEDGAEALDYLFCKNSYSQRERSNFPRVIFLDLKLPKMNGLEVLNEIRNNEITKLIPVVILTSSMEDSDIKEAYDLRVNSFIVKPVDFLQFVETIRNVGTYWLQVNHYPL